MLLIAGVTFVAVLAIILGAYWVVVVNPETRERGDLRRRLKVESLAKGRVQLLKDPEVMSGIGFLNTVLYRLGGLTALKDLLDQSGLPLTVGTFLLLTGVCALAAWVGALFYIPFWWAGPALAFGAAFIPYIVVGQARSRRAAKFEEQFPEAIELIARAMRAGHAFATGLKLAADELEEPVGTEFKLLYERQNYGAQMPDALRAFAIRVPSLDARFFVTAVLTQREAGGNLSEVLDRLAAVMRERFRVRREVQVRSAHGRITAFVLAGMPPMIAILMLSVSPEQMKILVNDPLGVRMIITAIVLQVIGTLIVRKLVDIEY